MIRIDNNSEKWYFLKISGFWGNWTCTLLDYDSQVEKYDNENFYYKPAIPDIQKNIIIKDFLTWSTIDVNNIKCIQQCTHKNDLVWHIYCINEKTDVLSNKINHNNIIQEMIIDYHRTDNLRHHPWIKNTVDESGKSIEYFENNLEIFYHFLLNMYYSRLFCNASHDKLVCTPLLKDTNFIIFSYEYSNKEKLYNKLSKFVDRERFDERYDILEKTNKKYLNLYKSFIEKLKQNQSLNILEEAFAHKILYDIGIHQSEILPDNHKMFIDNHRSKIIEWAETDYNSRYL